MSRRFPTIGGLNVRIDRDAILLLLVLAIAPARSNADPSLAPDQVEFFEAKVRPLLVQHCYECHSAEASELAGELRLDLAEGWRKGGASGEPAILPGKPDESPLIRALRHDPDVSAMPPEAAKLPDDVIQTLATWVKLGAPDPRTDALPAKSSSDSWEKLYQERLKWWSLQPIQNPPPPRSQKSHWARNDVDRFIEAKLIENGLAPVAEADRQTLARRLHFVLTGLPPDPADVVRFVANTSPTWYEDYVAGLLRSPRFGEHWARHWLDLVHYADTHGYEWDVPAKNAWMYRDYVIRAFNEDLPINRFFLEQLAGDLIEPRVDRETVTNAALVATMGLRLGERRHGDNAAAEGVTQEAITNVVDTASKTFLATTVACAQCHDHKLDAVAQSDFFALAGIFMSTRWAPVCVDAADRNGPVIEALKRTKAEIRDELARLWLTSASTLKEKLGAIPTDKDAPSTFPETLLDYVRRAKTSPPSAEDFAAERERRRIHNDTHLTLVADFTSQDPPAGWRWDGSGMKHGQARDGDIVLALAGDRVVEQILPAGRWTHLWSPRCAGSLRSDLMDVSMPQTFSLGVGGGTSASWSFIIDHAFHSERLQFLKQPWRWLTVTAGNFDTLEGGIDRADRRVYFEIATKSFNNYYPPRTGYGGVKEEDLNDPNSWFGITRIYSHPAGQPPLDDLARYAPLFTMTGDWTDRFVQLLTTSLERWGEGEADAHDARLLDEAIQADLLPNQTGASDRLANLLAAYRETEQSLVCDQTIGAMTDWNEGRDERIGVRGSYTEFGDVIPRGNIRFLGGSAARSLPTSSGRLEFAQSVIHPDNPLTARVFVNRVWQHLFGEGLVRTPDDFGHLGQLPSHPELLDHLAHRFVEEGWSLKQLIAYLVDTATWRQSSIPSEQALAVDPENRLWHHHPARRIQAEAIRDSILHVAGRLDPTLYGPPVDPYRFAEDAAKRLFRGPLDGNGRRSIYLKMTLMEPPRFLALFNQPLPKLTTGRRDVTNVPDQALALLNDPFVHALAVHWGEQVVHDDSTSPEERAARMYAKALGREPTAEEEARLIALAERSAALHGENPEQLLASAAAWQDVAHALFNLKEFIYVR